MPRGPLRDMARDLLASPGANANQWLCPRAVQGLLTQHERGLRSNGSVLWAILMLEMWARAFVKR